MAKKRGEQFGLFLLPLAILALVGCSRTDPPQRKQVSSSESQYAPMQHQAADGIEACRQQADAVLKRDSDIDQDIASAQEGTRGLAADPDPQLTSNLDEYGTSEQHDEMVAQCAGRLSHGPSVASGSTPGEPRH